MNEYKMFLEYVNNFLTVERFADYYGISLKEAHRIIEWGRNVDVNSKSFKMFN